MKKRNQHILFAFMLVSSFFVMGCKNGKTSQPQYHAKYREANLVGEWIRQEKDILPRDLDSNRLEKECIVEDTLVFGYNNEVVSRKKTTYHYVTFHPEEIWGEYEVLNGKYKMKNDTLTITLDYPNINRTVIGKDPVSLTPTIYLDMDGKDSISSYYAVRDLDGQSYTLVYYLRKWKGGGSQIDNKELKYTRK